MYNCRKQKAGKYERQSENSGQWRRLIVMNFSIYATTGAGGTTWGWLNVLWVELLYSLMNDATHSLVSFITAGVGRAASCVSDTRFLRSKLDTHTYTCTHSYMRVSVCVSCALPRICG